MKTYIKQMLVLFLASLACLFLLDAHAGKPIKVEVVAAVPDEAIQGDALPVRIIGAGFDQGSTVRFIVTDTRDDTQIEVGTVIYDSGTGDLVAQVKVKDKALVIGYDVEVITSSGRRGKGTTLFRVRERVGESDPCLTSTSPFPAFMFWRNLNTANNPEYTIFLSSEDGVCVRPLVDVPDSRNAWTWESSFGYDPAAEYGYVVWAKGGWGDDEYEIWLQQFTVQGNTIDSPPDSELLVVHPNPGNADLIGTSFPDIDISADLQKLAFTFYEITELEGIISEVHIIDIDACREPNPSCAPVTGTLILQDIQEYAPHPMGPIWGYIAWDPLGERIYIRQHRGFPEQRAVRMVTRIDGVWTDENELFVTDDYPEYEGVVRLGSGIYDGREKLAFRHSGECRTISVIDVADCEAGSCEAEAQFFGTDPSWTDRGTIIHEIVERVKKHPRKEIYNCVYSDFIGEWDPVNSEVTTLAEGEDPDAG